MSDNTLNNPLWQDACQRYADPQFAHLLLALQDESGLVINMLLMGYWLGDQHYALTPAEITLLSDEIEPLQQAILPLRQARKQLKACALADEYQQLKQLEMRLEQQQIAQLYRYFLQHREQWTKGANTQDNIHHCLHFYGCSIHHAQPLLHRA